MEEKIRLAVFGQKRLSREGGIEIVVKELCTRMAQNGCDITCYNRAGHHVSGAEYDKTIEYDGIRQKVVPTIEKKGLAAVSSSFFAALCSAFGRYDVVHMLSMIDEYDLQEFLDDEERNGKQEEETPAVVLPETKPEPTPDVEIEEPKEESSGGMNKILLLVFVAALGGAGAFFYFYIYKPKPKEETPQSENLETDQSLATVNEDNQSGNENGT